MTKIAPYGKAITAAVIACLSYLQPAVDDGVSASEVLGAAIAFLTAGAVVWAIPNKDEAGEHQDESVQPPSLEVEPEAYVADGLTLDAEATDVKPTRPAHGWGDGI